MSKAKGWGAGGQAARSQKIRARQARDRQAVPPAGRAGSTDARRSAAPGRPVDAAATSEVSARLAAVEALLAEAPVASVQVSELVVLLADLRRAEHGRGLIHPAEVAGAAGRLLGLGGAGPAGRDSARQVTLSRVRRWQHEGWLRAVDGGGWLEVADRQALLGDAFRVRAGPPRQKGVIAGEQAEA